MTWHVVARKDFEDAVRSWWLWGLSVVFVSLLALPPALFALGILDAPQGGGGFTTDIFLSIERDAMTIIVPLIAIVLSYASISRESESGTLKLLLSLPHSRRDVVAGKVAGRGGVLALSVLVGFVATLIVFPLTPFPFEFGSFFLFVLLTVALGLAFVAISVGVSAAAPTSRWAMVNTVTIYILFTVLWNRLVNTVVGLLQNHAGLGGEAAIRTTLFLQHLNPTQAFKSLAARLVFGGENPVVTARVSVLGLEGLQGQIRQQMILQSLADGVPFYLTDPAVVVLLALWLVVPPVLGYLVFEAVDL